MNRSRMLGGPHALNTLKLRGFVVFLETKHEVWLARQIGNKHTTARVCKQTGKVTYDIWTNRNAA